MRESSRHDDCVVIKLCDGLDNNGDGRIDEGFPDTDGDGIADCVDSDGDNDGVDDGADNCPQVANPVQTDSNNNGETPYTCLCVLVALRVTRRCPTS